MGRGERARDGEFAGWLRFPHFDLAQLVCLTATVVYLLTAHSLHCIRRAPTLSFTLSTSSSPLPLRPLFPMSPLSSSLPLPASHSMAPPIFRLSPELLLLVFEHLPVMFGRRVEEDLVAWPVTSSCPWLRHCATVCKRWTAPAQQTLGASRLSRRCFLCLFPLSDRFSSVGWCTSALLPSRTDAVDSVI
jgi:hypothetical protein